MPAIFAIPVFDKVLIHAPLQHLTALVNPAAARALGSALQGAAEIPEQVRPIWEVLQTPAGLPDRPPVPLFLGLIPTRACSLACRYCDFVVQATPGMSLDLARQSLEAYLDVLEGADARLMNVHFFGGEPFHAPQVVQFAVAYADRLAAAHSMQTHFEVTTNGIYSARLARWIADAFDTVVLSLDGPPDLQERQRPARNARPVFPILEKNARIFSQGPCELILRVCVTGASVGRLPAIADWMAAEFQPSTVCFESVHPTPQALEAGICAPDPYEFARQFNLAAQGLEAKGMRAVLSTADVSQCQASLCPVGKDALIVSPDGAVDACYLPEQVWQAAGLDLRLGRVVDGKLALDQAALQRTRALSVENKPGCAVCLSRYHCAGGCHVRHNQPVEMGAYPPECVQTRLATLANLLRALDQADLAARLLADLPAAQKVAHQASDLLSRLP